MKKHIPTVAGILLGLVFLMASAQFLFAPGTIKMPPIPEGTPMALFNAATMTTGFMKFVKVFEFLGAILVIIPRTRTWGLLVLCPIIVNILAFTQFIIGGGAAFMNPLLIVAVIAAIYLLWVDRKKLLGLLN